MAASEHGQIVWRRENRMDNRFTFAPGINISLKRQGVTFGKVRVNAETTVQKMRTVSSVLAVKVGEVIAIMVSCEDSVGSAFGHSPVLRCAKALLQRASASRHEST